MSKRSIHSSDTHFWPVLTDCTVLFSFLFFFLTTFGPLSSGLNGLLVWGNILKPFQKQTWDQTRFITAAIKAGVVCTQLKLFSKSGIKVNFRAISAGVKQTILGKQHATDSSGGRNSQNIYYSKSRPTAVWNNSIGIKCPAFKISLQ